MNTWRKSSFSAAGNCVEVNWRKSSFSYNKCVEVGWRKSSLSADGNCVEVANENNIVLVRNSNHIDRGALAFAAPAMKEWIDAIKSGEFD